MASRTHAFTLLAASVGCASSLFLAPAALADPVDPSSPLLPAPAPGPQPGPAIQAAGPDAPPPEFVAPPNGTPHLASPDAPPPGSTMDPQDADSPNVSYLKDLWQAVQNHDISGKQALLMGIAQRGMNTPIPAQAPGPNVPRSGGDLAAAPPAPADLPAGGAPAPAGAPIPADPPPAPTP